MIVVVILLMIEVFALVGLWCQIEEIYKELRKINKRL